MTKPEPVPALSTASDKWTPYRHPQPRDSPPELVIPDAVQPTSGSGYPWRRTSGSVRSCLPPRAAIG